MINMMDDDGRQQQEQDEQQQFEQYLAESIVWLKEQNAKFNEIFGGNNEQLSNAKKN
jgi:nicotinamide riboside kinase